LSSKKLDALLQLEREQALHLDGGPWEYVPAKPDEFIEGKMFLNLKGRVWASVKNDVCDFYESGKHRGVFLEGIGAGKSTKASIISTYETHRLLCLQDPQTRLGLFPSSKLTVLNMGPRAQQARKVVFGKIVALIDNAYWFRTRFPHDKKIITELRFPKNIYIMPGNSRETTPLGYDIVCAVLDEMNFYTDLEERDVAEEIWLAMERRLESRMADNWCWKLIGISSSKHEEDFGERMAKDPNVFHRRRALWDAKPHQYPGERVTWSPKAGESYEIPRVLLESAQKNPHKFKRDFMAMGSGAENPYFSNRDAITAAVDATRCRFQENGTLPDDLKPVEGATYAAHIDLGLSRDSCGLAVGYADEDLTVIHFLWRIKPRNGHEVSFAAVREAILTLRDRGFRFKVVSYDGWQSVDSIQILTAKGIECDKLSIDNDLAPYDTFLESVNEGRTRKCGFSAPFARARSSASIIHQRARRTAPMRSRAFISICDRRSRRSPQATGGARSRPLKNLSGRKKKVLTRFSQGGIFCGMQHPPINPQEAQ
jgi:hypothetical protein